jgi:hypothetical protein
MNAPERKFGQGIQCNDPDYLKAPGIPVGDTGHYCNLYKMGVMCHPVEFNIVLENMHFIISLLLNVIDEFRDEILEKKGSKMIGQSSMFVCANCSRTESEEGKGLKSCSTCLLTFYCSKECQKSHWKSAHKKECKEIVARHWDTAGVSVGYK